MDHNDDGVSRNVSDLTDNEENSGRRRKHKGNSENTETNFLSKHRHRHKLIPLPERDRERETTTSSAVNYTTGRKDWVSNITRCMIL